MIFIILGIVGILANANGWCVVPDIAVVISFIVGFVEVIIEFAIKCSINKSIRRF